jgi:hypothetical protein
MLLALAAFAASLIALSATLQLRRRRVQNNPHLLNHPLHFASTPNITFAYHESGNKHHPLVLVIHGFPDTAASFCPMLPALAAQGMPSASKCFDRRMQPACAH